jgi:hypothetical protein
MCGIGRTQSGRLLWGRCRNVVLQPRYTIVTWTLLSMMPALMAYRVSPAVS